MCKHCKSATLKRSPVSCIALQARSFVLVTRSLYQVYSASILCQRADTIVLLCNVDCKLSMISCHAALIFPSKHAVVVRNLFC